MWIRIEREVPFEPDWCLGHFCDFERLPVWVPNVRSATPLEHDGEGRASVVQFSAHGPEQELLSYVLHYRYASGELRVTWAPAEGVEDAVRGYATFEPSNTGGCWISYGLEYGKRWGAERELLRARATTVLEDFIAHLEAVQSTGSTTV